MIFENKKLTSFLGIFILAASTVAQDPCLDGNAMEVDNLVKRSPLYVVDSTPLCDRYITEAWYKADYYAMSTSPPGLAKCGTLYPIWLKDPIPSNGEKKTLTACEVGFSNNCTRPYDIDVKNCSSFLVYKLKQTDLCDSAYCFEPSDQCVNESIAEAHVFFHNITWTRNDFGSVKQYDPSVSLICSFTPADDDTLLYHIDWYVDNETVIQGQTVDKTSLNDAILTAADLNKAGKKINSWIHCVAGIKKFSNMFPCFSTSSNLFFAGIEVLNHTLSMERNNHATLMLRPTIPIVLETIETLTENTSVYLTSQIDVELSFQGSTGMHCQSQGSIPQCKVAIKSFTYNDRQLYEDPTNWYKSTSMLIHNYDQHKYDLAGPKLVLRLKTSKANGNAAQIYGNVHLHDVQINILDTKEEWKGKQCSSYADPHQRTFDGYKYECQETGCLTGKTYIFYRNKEHLQEVQVRHGSCWGKPRCVCAVAARSGQDVFTIDACHQREYINFPICNDNALKVIKETDKVYKIIFPTGTFVKIYLYNYGSSFWYINLEVYPTVADVGKTSGLCGVLDGDVTNDLRRRDGTQDNINSYSYHNPPDGFSLSWQLPLGSVDDLLSMSNTVFDQLTPLSTYLYKLCTCNDKKIQCSYEKYTRCETNVRSREYHCVLHSSSRKKRDLEFFTQLQENIDVKTEELIRIKRQALNEIDAYDICNDAFQQSSYYDTCLQVVPNFSNETLVNCLNDIVMTGNHNLTQLHLDTALGQCQTYISLNPQLVNDNPDVTTIIVNLCPNNCSSRGVCSSGNCTCDYGFGGSDCSFDVSSLPTIKRLSGDGVCDKSSDSCEDITLYGKYFFENMRTTCYLTREEMSENNIIVSDTSYAVEFQERTLYEGFCSLEYGLESSFYTTFHFNLSNDGTQFSSLYTVYIYQSACQTFQNISGKVKVTLQSGYCYINGTCIQNGTFKSNNSCWQCLTSSNAFDWTSDCATSATMEPLSPTSTPRSFISTSQSTTHSLSQTTDSPPAMASMTSDENTRSTTRTIFSSSITTLNSESEKSVSTINQSDTTSSNRVGSSTASVTTSFLSSSVAISTLSNTDDEAANQQTAKREGLSAVAMGLITAVGVVVAVIIAIAGYMLKQKISKKKVGKHSTLETSIENDVNIYPEINRTMANKGISEPSNLFQFDSPADKSSRPPSATSTRPLPPHQDFRTIYDQNHLDQLFAAK